MNRIYKVTVAIDYLDTNPTIKFFDCFYELQDYINFEASSSSEDLVSIEEIEESI